MPIMNSALMGQQVENNPIPIINGNLKSLVPVTDLNGNKLRLALSEDILSRHLLLLGNTGTGKTNVFDFILKDLRRKASSDDVFLIFDSKGDFLKKHFQQEDKIIGNAKDVRSKSAIWNLFEEILADGMDMDEIEINARELSKALFHDHENKNQPFFSNAACDIFANMIMYAIKRNKQYPDVFSKYINNEEFIGILKKMPANQYIQCFEEYDDMKSLINYLGDAKNLQGLGVLGELKSMLNDYFLGVFSKKSDEPFSMKRFVRKRGGHAAFIEYDLAGGETLEPIYRILFDLALKEAMGSNTQKGSVYLIADEFRMIPKLQHINDGLNFGRSKGVKIIAAIQSVSQLEEIYGEAASKVMLAGFSSLIVFKCNDPSSRQYVSERFGKNVTATDYVNTYDQTNTHVREGYVVEDWIQNSILNQRGTAIVSLIENDPFCVRFAKYPEDN